MVLVKSLFAGFAATIAAAFAIIIAIVGLVLVKSRNLPDGQAYGWDPVSFFCGSALSWLILVGAFLRGFVWEYRRASGAPSLL
jgi:hypothetical protein